MKDKLKKVSKVLECKCSRCGKTYYNEEYADGPNAIAFGINDGDDFDLAYDVYTLCPECIDELMMFLDHKKRDVCSNIKRVDINKCPETLDTFKKLLNSINIDLKINYRRTYDIVLFEFFKKNKADFNLVIGLIKIPVWYCYTLPESELVKILFEFIQENG